MSARISSNPFFLESILASAVLSQALPEGTVVDNMSVKIIDGELVLEGETPEKKWKHFFTKQ